MEEHDHSAENCFDADGNLVCLLGVHIHEDACLFAPIVTTPAPTSVPTPAPVYYCGTEEHTHTAELCYDAENNLICELIEHTHDDACLIAPTPTHAPVYYCGTEEHTHAAELCYDAENNLICELIEHIHDDSCLIAPTPTPAPVYYCGTEEHTHPAELCYDAENNLICELVEHTHDDSCLIPAELVVSLTPPEGAYASAFVDEPYTLNVKVEGGAAPWQLRITVTDQQTSE